MTMVKERFRHPRLWFNKETEMVRVRTVERVLLGVSKYETVKTESAFKQGLEWRYQLLNRDYLIFQSF
jgi:hypothetical protein